MRDTTCDKYNETQMRNTYIIYMRKQKTYLFYRLLLDCRLCRLAVFAVFAVLVPSLPSQKMEDLAFHRNKSYLFPISVSHVLRIKWLEE